MQSSFANLLSTERCQQGDGGDCRAASQHDGRHGSGSSLYLSLVWSKEISEKTGRSHQERFQFCETEGEATDNIILFQNSILTFSFNNRAHFVEFISAKSLGWVTNSGRLME